MKKLILHFFLFFSTCILAQVGINTTTPNAQLDIRSSNQVAPTSTDGMLIPKIDTFPATNPTVAQQGMLVYLTTNVGSNLAGFYYWDNITLTWIPIGNNNNSGWSLSGNAGTNSATNFMGTTDNQDVVLRRNNLISGRIGTFNTSFGLHSLSTNTSGLNNSAFGAEALRNSSGSRNTAFGVRSLHFNFNGNDNTAFGYGAMSLSSPGNYNSAFGNNAEIEVANLTNATAIGANALVGASNSLVLGSISGVNSATSSVNVGVGSTTPSAVLDVTSSDKGILIPRVSLSSADIASPITNPNGGVLPESTLVYNTVTAGVGENEVTPGFHYWNGIKWIRFDVDGEKKPKYYTALGTTNLTNLNSNYNIMPEMTITMTPNDSVIFVNFSASGYTNPSFACGQGAIFFQINVNGVPVKGWQTNIEEITNVNSSRPVWDTSINYPINVSQGVPQTISILWTTPNCPGLPINMVNTPATTNSGPLYQAHRHLTVIDPNGGGGVVGSPPVTTDVWSLNGNTGTNPASQFVGTADAQPLLLKSNNIEGLRIETNGRVGIGTATPAERLHVSGRTLYTNGFSADNAALLYQNNTNYMFLGPQSGTSTNGAAMALYGSTNNNGSNLGGINFSVPIGEVRINHSGGSHVFRANSTSGYNSTFELNDAGLQIGHNSASRSILFNPDNTERMRLTPTGNLGLGTNNPVQKLHVSGPAGLTAIRIGNTSPTGVTNNLALEFFRQGNANTDWRIYNIGPNLTFGNSGDDYATVNDLYQFQGGRFMPMNDATQNLGLGTNRWNTLFASNGTINTSDAREKKNIQNLNYGLTTLMQLRPVSFEWKKDDGSGTKLGLIAQELQQVVPEVVRDWDWEEDDEGNRKKVSSPILGVYYSDLIPVLIKATQEQQLVIEQQREEINLFNQQLQEQYKSLLERLEKVENK